MSAAAHPPPLSRTPTEVDHEKADKADTSSTSPSSSAAPEYDVGHGAIVTAKSRGVLQMEAMHSRLSTKWRILLYSGFTLLAYVMSLNQYTASSYLSAATSVSFSAHSTLTTISSIRSVFQAVSQPPIAKIADGAGRLEAYALCVFLYALGYIVVASAQSVYAYAVGNSIYILGITGLFLLQNIIISDISSTRNRLFFSILPSVPGVINVWVSGNITQSLLGSRNENAGNWRWGIGMFAILTPVLALPIMFILGFTMRQTKQQKADKVAARAAPTPAGTKQTFGQKALSIFWQLDIIGLLLLVAGFGMVLVTVTIANGKGSHWSDAHCIALLTVGGVCIVAFGLWERFGARHPLIPFRLLTNRTVIICLIIAVIYPAAGGVIGSYLYTYLLVAGQQSTLSATRIGSIAGFTSTLTAAAMGIVVRYMRYLKPVIIAGFCIDVLAFGLMIRYRGAGATRADLVAVQIVRGLGAGCISFPVQAAIQVVSKHEHLAAITASYLTIFYLSQGIGSAIGGGIWTNTVPERLNELISNSTLARQAYANPIGLISRYPPGTEVRDALATAHGDAQRILSITGTCLAVVGLLLACCLQNVRLTDEQSLEQVEKAEDGKMVAVDNK